MKKDFHISISTNISAKEAFEKISKVGDWWLTSFKGKALEIDDAFSVIMGAHGNTHFKIVEAVLGKKIVWLVTDCHLSNYKDKKEWKNTKMVFELTETNGKTKLDFTHVGLTSDMECYSDCEWGWNHYITGSLPKFFETGKGTPYNGTYEQVS